ncbi:MAG TPA: IPT/TIG domain-containing protein, partial [Acidimicrobiales bacterium]
MGRGIVLVVAMLAATCASPADDSHDLQGPPRVAYVYDETGRLRAVIDPESDAAKYAYDAVGNIVGISRHSSDELSVIAVTPGRAEVGDTVVIHGTGFGGGPSDNTVRIGDVEADVTSAGPLELQVEVPEGARSGQVTVEASHDSAKSDRKLEVVPDRTPVIDDLPRVAAAGEPVTIGGENFSEDRLLDSVVLDGATYAAVDSATTDELQVRIPPTATS